MKARMASSSFSIGLAKPAATARVGGSKGALWGVETVKRSLFGSSPAGPVATAGVGYNKVERFGRTGSKRIYAEVKRSERASLGAEWMTNLLRVVPLSRPLQEARARLRLHLHSLMRMYSLMVCTGAHLGVLGALGAHLGVLGASSGFVAVGHSCCSCSGQVCSSGWGAALGEGIALNEGVASFSVATDNLSTCARLPLLKAQASIAVGHRHAWSTSAIAVGHRHAWLINDARAVLLDVCASHLTWGGGGLGRLCHACLLPADGPHSVRCGQKVLAVEQWAGKRESMCRHQGLALFAGAHHCICRGQTMWLWRGGQPKGRGAQVSVTGLSKGGKQQEKPLGGLCP
eukprot:1139345-Pelagomonas_calceolata.AAC.10